MPEHALREAALDAARQAYAPYSTLRVGAAVRSAAGGIHRGCNVENSALPVGGCAERAAIAAAVLAEGAELTLVELALVALIGEGMQVPASPCGACRQAIVEMGPDIRVEYLDVDGAWAERTARELLPGSFVLPTL